MKNAFRWLMCLVPVFAITVAGCGGAVDEKKKAETAPPPVTNPGALLPPGPPGSPETGPSGAAAPGGAAPGGAAPGGAPATK
jgi:hypothetical protein